MLSDNGVIEIFYMAGDFCNFFNETVEKHSIDDGKKHRNKPSRLSDAEIITILIMFHIGGYKCLKHFYINYICKHCHHLFPKTVSYNSQTTTDHHTSPVGTTEVCRAYSALIGFGSFKQRFRCRSIA